jgi:purine-binding chemotaxis protein CheW
MDIMGDRKAMPVLLCRLATRLIGVPIEHVVETMRPLPIEKLSGAPQFVVGASVIRGAPTPVVDAGRLLGESESRPRRFVTVRAGGRTVALSVDEVLGVSTIPAETLQALPPLLRDAGAEAVAAIGTLDAQLLLVLDSARVVPAELPTITPERLDDDGAGA